MKKLKQVLFEGTPVVFTPLDAKGKHPELVVVDVQDLIKASERHRAELKRQRDQIRAWALDNGWHDYYEKRNIKLDDLISFLDTLDNHEK